MRNLIKNDKAEGPAAMVGVVVSGLVAIIIGILIWYSTNTAIFTAAKKAGPQTAMNATWGTVNATANTVWTLFPIIAIVVVAGIILAVVMGFGRQQA